MTRHILIATAAFLALVACAKPPPKPPVRAAVSYYPFDAEENGVEGEATLHCARDPQLALKDCALISETPTGDGFGKAAMAMAASSPANPKLDVSDADADLQPRDITVRFRLHPERVEPDLGAMGHQVTNPDWLQPPDGDAMARVYPPAAARAKLSGHVRLQCAVAIDGRLTGCVVTEETPPGQHFGDAALALTDSMRMKPMLIDGQPVAGASVVVPIGFRPE